MTFGHGISSYLEQVLSEMVEKSANTTKNSPEFANVLKKL